MEPTQGLTERTPVLDDGPSSGPLPDQELVAASEAELQRAVAVAWPWVSGPRSSEYLDRLIHSVARVMEGVPEGSRVLLVDLPTVLRLALPSGRVLLSLGALRAIEDEAELVFVLGHELAHVASGDASRALVETGLVELARSEGGDHDGAWLRTAENLIRQGYGTESEHQADLQGLRAMLALGYDPESMVHYLDRMGRALAQHDRQVADTMLAHPLPGDRISRLRESWGVYLRDPGARRVNRDAFRRAVGYSAMTAELRTTKPFADEESAGPLGRRFPWRDSKLIGTGMAILFLTALFLLLGLLLAR